MIYGYKKVIVSICFIFAGLVVVGCPSPIPSPTPTDTPLTLTATPINTSVPSMAILPPSPTAGEEQTFTMLGTDVAVAFVYVPSGDFTMGSDKFNDAKPVRTVTLDAFWIMKTEVTNEQFEQFIKADGYGTEEYWSPEGWTWIQTEGHTEPGFWNDERFTESAEPVVGISWYEAQALANWLSDVLEQEIALPSEAQWEKAARGPDGRAYPWVGYFEGSIVNYCDKNCKTDWAEKSRDDGYPYTAPVGSYLSGASPYGALDMAGNVWEWVADWYDSEYYRDAPSVNPTGPEKAPEEDSHRVFRGGSWVDPSTCVRAAYRDSSGPTARSYRIGVRLAMPPGS